MRNQALSTLLVASLAFAVPASAQEMANVARGFAPEKVYDFGGIDAINTFNGGLTLSIPIGQSYPVNSALSYQLQLTYGSQIWDYREKVLTGTGTFIQAFARDTANAGAGWMLSLGMLLPPGSAPSQTNPSTPVNNTIYWVYVSPDGARHTFFNTLRDGQATTAGTCFTRDGSYLRLKGAVACYQNANGLDVTVELPNGVKHRFQRTANTASVPLRLTEIRDAFDNVVTIGYPATGQARWEISDGHRLQTVYFKPFAGATVVDKVDLATPAGIGRYTFNYEDATISRSCKDNDELAGAAISNPTPLTARVALLRSLLLPDGSSYTLNTYEAQCGTSAGPDGPGMIRQITLPTGGRIVYDYQLLTFVQQREPIGDGTGLWVVGYGQTTGLASKTLFDRNGQQLGQPWTYVATTGVASNNYERQVLVTTPRGDQTVNWFVERSVNQNGFPSQSWDYGLPMRKTVGDGFGRLLSQEIYAGTVAGGNKVRSTYVTYEGDSTANENVNRRVSKQRTTYHDDGGRWQAVDSSDWDYIGHYRQQVLSGNLSASDARTDRTEYGVQPATGDRWILGRFSQKSTVADGGKLVSDYCFDADGFLLRTRTRADASAAAALGVHDIVTAFGRSWQGNVASEYRYGGDNQTLSTSTDLCNVGLPWPESGAEYAYQYGTRSQSTQLSAPFSDYQAVNSPATGQALTSTDPTGLVTTYEYDTMGRLRWVMPQDGDGSRSYPAWSEYKYTPQTAGQPAEVQIFGRTGSPPTQGGTISSEQEVYFDGFGRVARERRRVENAWVERTTSYHPTGEKSAVSEWGATPGGLTQYLNLDPFGRATTIRPPDGASHDVTMTYLGAREVQRNSPIATTWNGSQTASTETTETRKERYDARGRLVEVIEHSAVDGSNVSTSYNYEVGGHLSRVSTGAQLRTFTYDGLGFLRNEKHPEQGGAGVSYSKVDTRGNAGEVNDGVTILAYERDWLGRVTAVRRKSDNAILQSVYYNDDGNPGGGTSSRGQLTHAERVNYVSLNGGSPTQRVTIAEDFKYWGLPGRVSDHTTSLIVDGQGQVESFTDHYGFDGLGNLKATGYPECNFPDCTEFRPASPSFGDVPNGHANHDEIEAILRAGVTAGCGAGNFCPATAVVRWQAAIFLLRSKEGASYSPPACGSPIFADVPCSDPHAPWINELYRRGVTAGCGFDANGNRLYCPDQNLNRNQAAVMLVRTADSTFVPAICDGFFTDLPACATSTPPYFPEEAVRRGYLAGTSGSTFAPSTVVTRAAMAVALVNTFDLDRSGNARSPRTVDNQYVFGWLSNVTPTGLTASTLDYHASGLPSLVSFGNNTNVSTSFATNGLGRPTSIQTSGIRGLANWSSGTYSYDGDGNVKGIGNWVYRYDQVDRLVGARNFASGTNATIADQTYAFDSFGNLTGIASSTGYGRTVSVSSSTNRLNGAGSAYDAAGNLTQWNTGALYDYDAFHQVWRMRNGSEHWVYAYNAAGERTIAFRVDAAKPRARWTLRNPAGQALRDYEARGGYFVSSTPKPVWSLDQDYIWRGSSLLATVAPGTEGVRYYALDHLGTPRAISNSYKQLVGRHDYLPFGEEVTARQEGFRLKFTGHERDLANPTSTADDLDYMHARHYNPQIGRFTSVDPVLGTPRIPQSWNRYAYGLGSPIQHADPDGRLPINVLMKAALIAQLMLQDGSAQVGVVGPVLPGKALGALVPQARGGIKGLEYYSVDLTDAMSGGDAISITLQKSGLGVSATGAVSVPPHFDELSVLFGPFEHSFIGSEPDKLTTGLGSVLGIELDVDLPVLLNYTMNYDIKALLTENLRQRGLLPGATLVYGEPIRVRP
jgi:RHS repeat-associated protein